MKVYNMSDIYIFKVYEKKYENEYYDNYYDAYVTNTFFKLKEFCLGIIKEENKIFDIINNKEIEILNVNMEDNQEFILIDEYLKLNKFIVEGSKDIDMSLKVISKVFKIINEDLVIQERENFDKLYYFEYPHLEKGYCSNKREMLYGTDKEYYDEYKEYRKERLRMPKGVRNKIIM